MKVLLVVLRCLFPPFQKQTFSLKMTTFIKKILKTSNVNLYKK